jgi:inosine-uridine nucleoside N-ribohydrolase
MPRFLSIFVGLLLGSTALAEPARVPVIIDTDIGSDIDDALALGLAVASPELEVRAITTCGGSPDNRAWLVCRFLTQVGIKDVPVAIGKPPNMEYGLDWQIQYRRHPAAIFNRTLKPVKDSAVELMYQKLKADQGNITIICLGPLTNIAALLKEHPDAKPWIKRLVIMGGSIKVGYSGKPPAEREWNIKHDIAAAQAVFVSGVPITLVPLDVTAKLELKKDQREKIFAAHTPLTWQVQNLYELWDKETPILFDPLAVALGFEEKFCKFKEMALEIDSKGMTNPGRGKANARLALTVDAEAFTQFFVDRLRSHGKEVLPAPPQNLSRFVEQGNFPSKVHCFEDYDTDIEKRWWMSGKLETKEVPPGSKRCCRATLTQDFDDRQGDMKAMYRAVIFNPVPGPPMGKNTRLSFRFKVDGTSKLRVQLYSLTNGYHRYLTLEGFRQGLWRRATVDMTQMRRPDGSGGPLSENERIDDIQFYIDPRAELLIDDIILYDAAAEGEKRPFPKRILYTGWFDTGKQGKEWPGEFEIVEHEKKGTWKYAKSVRMFGSQPILEEQQQRWISLNIRGERSVDEVLELSFRYRLLRGEEMTVTIANPNTKFKMSNELKTLKKNEWSRATTRFKIDDITSVGSVREINFQPQPGAELHLDDVLLYVPGYPPKK